MVLKDVHKVIESSLQAIDFEHLQQTLHTTDAEKNFRKFI